METNPNPFYVPPKIWITMLIVVAVVPNLRGLGIDMYGYFGGLLGVDPMTLVYIVMPMILALTVFLVVRRYYLYRKSRNV